MQNCRNQTTKYFRGPHKKLVKEVIIALLFDYGLLQRELFKTEEPWPCGLLSCWCTKRPGEGAPTPPQETNPTQWDNAKSDGNQEEKGKKYTYIKKKVRQPLRGYSIYYNENKPLFRQKCILFLRTETLLRNNRSL